MRRLVESNVVFGIEVIRYCGADTINLYHEFKALAWAEVFGIAGLHRLVTTPPADCGDLHSAHNGQDRADHVTFQSGTCSLLHIAQCAQPGIAVSVHAPPYLRRSRQERALRRCLKSCSTLAALQAGDALIPMRQPGGGLVRCKLAVCTDTRQGRSGRVATLHGGAVSWEGCKQLAAGSTSLVAVYQACAAFDLQLLLMRQPLDRVLWYSGGLELTSGAQLR